MARKKPVGWPGEHERHVQAGLKGNRRMNRDAMRWAIDPWEPKVVPAKLRELAIDADWISPMQDMVDELRKGKDRRTVYSDYLALAEDALAQMELAEAGFMAEEVSKDEIRRMKPVVTELTRLYRSV